jgi:hypothetical protein
MTELSRTYPMRAVLLLACLSVVWTSAIGAEICPSRPGQHLRFVDVFDGPPEEMASLIPDQVSPRSGWWTLGYVYDAGRNVTIRCKYTDGHSLDVQLARRVNRCTYWMDAGKTARLSCQ